MRLRKNVFIMISFLFLYFFVTFSLPAENRVALVIGNGKYPNSPLKNPPNDAEDVSRELEGLGFKVIKGINADYKTMIKLIRDFEGQLNQPDTVALFYFSGHGIQVNGKNYLIPADADIQNANEVQFCSIEADFVYSKLQNPNVKTSIVILDACRNNPFAGSERSGDRGLSAVVNLPPQSIIIYATGPNQTAQDGSGRNGTFTSAFLKHLNDPMDIELMLRSVRDDVSKMTMGKQIPWSSSSLTGVGFSFIPGAESSAAVKASLEIAGLPPETDVIIDGKKYLTAGDREQVKVGDFPPGTYTLSLSGPYLSQPLEMEVVLKPGDPVVIKPEISELGQLQLRQEEGQINPLQIIITPESGENNPESSFIFNPQYGWNGYLPAGEYSLSIRRQDDTTVSYLSTVVVEGGQRNEFLIPEIDYSVDYKIGVLEAEKAEYEYKLSRVPKKKRNGRIVGWSTLGAGVVFSGAAIWSFIAGNEAYKKYESTSYSSDAAAYRDKAELYSMMFTGFLITAGLNFLVSPIAFTAHPNEKKIEDTLNDFERQLEELRNGEVR